MLGIGVSIAVAGLLLDAYSSALAVADGAVFSFTPALDKLYGFSYALLGVRTIVKIVNRLNI
jgi:hypothetical protein